MDIVDLRGVATLFCMIAFACVVYWAYGPSRKDYFEQAAELPFADDEDGGVAGSPGARQEVEK